MVDKVVRPIDANEVFISGIAKDDEYGRGFIDGLEKALRAVKAAHTLDAVVVVRCKDCEHYHEFISGFRCVHFNGGDGRAYQVKPNDFCSYGKRRCEDG